VIDKIFTNVYEICGKTVVLYKGLRTGWFSQQIDGLQVDGGDSIPGNG
jgi:hypothetical protein